MTTGTTTIDRTRYDSIRSAWEHANKSIGNKYKSWNDYIEDKYEPYQSKTVESTCYQTPGSERKTKNNFENDFVYNGYNYTAKRDVKEVYKPTVSKSKASENTEEAAKLVGLGLLAILALIIGVILKRLPLYLILKRTRK